MAGRPSSREFARCFLDAPQRVSTERIMADLGVSRETVRRDLLDLEALGELRRVHGGAILSPLTKRPSRNAPTPGSNRRRRSPRRRWGSSPAVKPCLSTPARRPRRSREELAKLANLTVVTNSIDVALKMRGAAEQQAEARNEVILLGGSISTTGAMATGGSTTILDIHRYRADVAFAVAGRHRPPAWRHQLRSRGKPRWRGRWSPTRSAWRSSPITARSGSPAATHTARRRRSTC